ncbi:MAG: hypothetical protein GX977_06250 [Firmicutes bacterium]|mgnify:FL=1|nr:hypothetical protein [Bacillota bacterium]
MVLKRTVAVLSLMTLLILLFCISSYAEQVFSMKDLEDKLIFEHDEFRGITFINHPREQAGRSVREIRFLPYIGRNDSSKWMFLRAYYKGKSWIFMEQVYVLVDGERYVTPVYHSYSDLVQHHTFSGGVIEIIDFKWSDSEIAKLGKAIVNSHPDATVKVRFAGRENRDFELTAEDVMAWKEVIYYFDNLEIE